MIHAISALVFFAFTAPAMAATYMIDPAHSSVAFSIRHLLAKVNGGFNEFEGEFNFDAARVEATTGKVIIKTGSIDTNNPKRDEHLRSPDFFDAAKNPEMSFVVKKVTADKKDKKKFKIEGDFTMHGVTHPESFAGEYMGTEKDPWGNVKAGFSAIGKVNRKNYGIVFNKTLDSGAVMLGDDVEVSLNFEAAEKVAEKK
jgi:polyisoprenoid-binding protein YceI